MDEDKSDSRESRSGNAYDSKKASNREAEANEAAKKSKKNCRVYVGNLAFGVKWNDLKDFMRDGGFMFSLSLHLLEA